MDPESKKQQVGKSEVADLSIPAEMNPKTKRQKLSNSQKVDTSLVDAMKKQNEIATFLTGKVIAAKANNSNLVFSPASINALLTMVAATSIDNEKLRSYILSFLRSSSTDELNAVFREVATVVLQDGSASGGPKIAAVNGVWIDQSVSVDTSSKDLLVNFFKADFALVDFRSKAEEVREEVNEWAKHHTNGLIKDLLAPGSVTKLTERIYGNALYFKGVWKLKFDKSLTERKPFHLLNDKSEQVPFMRSHKSQFITVYDGFKALKLPYRQGRDGTKRNFSMYIYLPDKKDGLDNLVEEMAATHNFLDSHIPSHKVEVGEFRIPKFKIEFGFEVSDIINDLGREMSVYQKALIEIDEEGTKAAAATVGRTMQTCSRYRSIPIKIDFVADHPFLYFIREDKTGTVLFAGQILDPSKSF